MICRDWAQQEPHPTRQVSSSSSTWLVVEPQLDILPGLNLERARENRQPNLPPIAPRPARQPVFDAGARAASSVTCEARNCTLNERVPV
eukprot:78017-Rhodomonas_salina.8